MARYRLITLVNAKNGREAEMNDWYDNQHVPDLLTIPGVVAAQRFRVCNAVAPAEPLFRYMNVFEVEADDPMAVLAEIRKSGFPLVDAFELVSMAIYEPHAERVTAG